LRNPQAAPHPIEQRREAQLCGFVDEGERGSFPADHIVALHSDVVSTTTTTTTTPPTKKKAARQRIAKLQRVTLRDVPADERAVLVDRLYSIFLEFFGDLDREAFARAYFHDDKTRLALCYGADGDLVGFSAASIGRIELGGRHHAVFSAPVLIRLGYRAGSEVALFGLTEALAFKLRHPWTPLAYVSATATPASYLLFARTVRRFYPSRNCETPASIPALVELVRQQRGLEQVTEGGWVVRSGRPIGAQRLRANDALSADPDVAFFERLSPRWLDGEALLVWIPLDVDNIATGIVRAVRERLWPARRHTSR
jgi:hypothetical protein